MKSKELRGRIAKSEKTRSEQVADAQRKFRVCMKRRGLRPVQAYLPKALVTALDEDARNGRQSRGERLTDILRPIYGWEKKVK